MSEEEAELELEAVAAEELGMPARAPPRSMAGKWECGEPALVMKIRFFKFSLVHSTSGFSISGGPLTDYLVGP